jgi:hypothetical protein
LYVVEYLFGIGQTLKMKNKLTVLVCAILSVIMLNNVKAQNIVEINPTLTTVLGWDYTLPDSNVLGFKIYRKTFVNNVVGWELVGEKSNLPNTTLLELQFTLPKPAMGTYVVTAYNGSFESDKSEEITLIESVIIIPDTEPLPPTGLRILQLPE